MMYVKLYTNHFENVTKYGGNYEMNLEILFSDYYKVLSILYDNCTTFKDETYCPLSQEEIAQELGITRLTVSVLLKRLKELGYISFDSPRKYMISTEVRDVMKQLKNIKQKGIDYHDKARTSK